jgi:uncharacterized protein with NRDE domain
MCLAIFSVQTHADWPLILVANRDEFHERPTAAMQPWAQQPSLLAGQDLRAGGTWLGVNADGRLALLTNVRDPGRQKASAPSRGLLVQQFLNGAQPPEAYLHSIAAEANQYNGFNLLLADNDSVWHASNHQEPFAQAVSVGIHGLSNALLDTPWPKTHRTSQALKAYLNRSAAHAQPTPWVPDPSALAQILFDAQVSSDAQLPQTGVSLERERLLSAPFIRSADYGTRCMTVVLRHRSGYWWVQEESFDAQGHSTGTVRWQHQAKELWCRTHQGPGISSTC